MVWVLLAFCALLDVPGTVDYWALIWGKVVAAEAPDTSYECKAVQTFLYEGYISDGVTLAVTRQNIL